MTNDSLELTRRKILAGAGAIGVAGAGAGLGSSAFFSDRENFTNNRLVAGSLDLKVGWESHYSDWSDDEADGIEGDIVMESDRETGEVGSTVDSRRFGLPANAAAMLSFEGDLSATRSADAKQFLDNTQEDQYPSGYDSDDFPSGSSIDCETTILADDDGAPPVISLDDVKPGDFGEITFSFALCDNPGYVWARAFLEDASENGYTEPELEDDDEDGPGGDTVELLDVVQAAVWLDDGNNYQNCGEQPLVVGSLREIINGNHPQVDGQGLRLDGRNVPNAEASGPDKPDDVAFTAIGVNRFDYETDGEYGVDFELVDDPAESGRGKVAKATSFGEESGDYATSAVPVCERLSVVYSDEVGPLTYEFYTGEQNTANSPDEVYLLIQDSDGTQSVVWRSADIDGNGWQIRNVAGELLAEDDWNVITDTGHETLGDPIAAFGSDAELLAMAAGVGGLGGKVSEIYVTNPALDGLPIGTFPTSCFRGDGTVYNGVFAWWVPVNHGNEIQSDAVSFDLGFYAEQCRHNPGEGQRPVDEEIRLETVATGLTAPNWGTAVPGCLSDRLVVTDQDGLLWAVDLTTGGKSVLLDVSDRLVSLGVAGPGTFDERGLLGVAFHPEFADNGLVYTYTSEPVNGAADFSTMPSGEEANHQSVLSEWTIPEPCNPSSVVDPETRREILRIDQPQFNHNAGGLVFGLDGELYVSLGDGGAADDQGVGHVPGGNGQDPSNILGTILRITPTGSTAPNGAYGIPTDNPFVGESGFRDEIFAFGFRNPFRFSFDSDTGEMYIADVGQNDIEEIDLGVAGGNYGWRLKEGDLCFDPNGDDPGFAVECDPGEVPAGLIDPIAQYDHDEGIAIVGGFVYRGSALPSLTGRYIFGDFFHADSGGGRLFHLTEANQIREFQYAERDTLGLSVLGFGQDTTGEVYLLANETGTPFGDTGVVLRITAP